MIDLRNHIYYLSSQGNIGCCTASATLTALEIMMSMYAKPTNFSRLYVYYMTRKLQGRLGKKGAELFSTLDSISKFGVCTEKTWPFRFKNAEIEPGASAKSEAEQYKIKNFKSIMPMEFNTCLDNKQPVIVGMFTGKQFWKLSGPLNEQCYIPINSTDNRMAQGHAVTIVGYNNINGGSWIIANSLGSKWGYVGYGLIPYSCSRDMGESYVITDFTGTSSGNFPMN